VALASIGFWFTVQQDSRQADTEEQRAQDVALQAYLDQMSTLLINHDLGDLEKGSSEVRTLARARTLTVLSRLDGGRKGSALEFLHEAHLIERDPNIVRLANADLRDADLSGADLNDANLSDANLNDANLNDASLSWANLYDADLSGANLSGAKLTSTDLSNADLSYASLSGAHLNFTVLSTADLSDANLSNAKLYEAWLSDANLERAEGITEERLEQQGAVLEGATMPDGSKHP
jgi:uncharacterized protein YjbI with pentapeptide repeats